jgi:hypothetical protein
MCNHPGASDDEDTQDTQEGFKLLMKQYIKQATDRGSQQHWKQQQQQQQHHKADSSSSRTQPASASGLAGASGGQHRDLLSLPIHELLLHVLRTSIIRQQSGYAAEVVSAMLQLPADKQPGGPFMCSLLRQCLGVQA